MRVLVLALLVCAVVADSVTHERNQKMLAVSPTASTSSTVVKPIALTAPQHSSIAAGAATKLPITNTLTGEAASGAQATVTAPEQPIAPLKCVGLNCPVLPGEPNAAVVVQQPFVQPLLQLQPQQLMDSKLATAISTNTMQPLQLLATPTTEQVNALDASAVAADEEGGFGHFWGGQRVALVALVPTPVNVALPAVSPLVAAVPSAPPVAEAGVEVTQQPAAALVATPVLVGGGLGFGHGLHGGLHGGLI